MARILGIETSCDETGAAVFDSQEQKLLSNTLYSQIDLHHMYGGVVPEIASRSQLEKIRLIVEAALDKAHTTLDAIDAIAITNKPGLAGSLLVGLSFCKALAWSTGKKIIGVDHLEGHLFSPFLQADYTVNHAIPFPHICLTASGGHTALYLVHSFGRYELLVDTEDDAAGEAFDKISKVLGLGYPGGARIEQYAAQADFQDINNYSRLKNRRNEFFFSFSGLKTAVLYHLVNQGLYDLANSQITRALTDSERAAVSSSLLLAITDIFEHNIKLAFKKYSGIKALTFGGGVACNRYIKQRFTALCSAQGKSFFAPPAEFCTDNGAMIAFVGGYKAAQGIFSDITLDIGKN